MNSIYRRTINNFRCMLKLNDIIDNNVCLVCNVFSIKLTCYISQTYINLIMKYKTILKTIGIRIYLNF